MPQPTPQWKTYLPEFLTKIKTARNEGEIQSACEVFKRVVCECYPNTPSSRDRPMSEARKAIREQFPAKETKKTNPDFPYFFTETGKDRIPRWEHLAIRYLEAEWNRKGEVVKPDTVEVVKTETTILDELGLTTDEKEAVNQAIGESDIKEWVRLAIMQRANAINNKKAVMDEDLTEVPSETLMNDKKYRTNPTAARELTRRAIRVVKQWNHDHPDQKWCITNKLIGELTGVTVKAIAKAVEGMDLETYNKNHDLTPVVNRMVKGEVGEASKVMSIAKVTGVEGSEENYQDTPLSK
jgi:hypothetical protein